MVQSVPRIRLLACALATVVAGWGAVASPASATPAGGDEPLDPAAQLLVDRYHITPAEANARIVLQDRATVLLDDLQATFADTYGGLWIDQLAGGTVVVGVRPGQERTVRELAARRGVDRVRVVPVERTVAQLRAVQAQLRHTLATQPSSGLGVGGIYVPTNQVNVRVDATALATAAGAALASALDRTHPGRLRFVPVRGVAMTAACVVNGEFNVWCDPPLRGGIGITASGVRCSAAFNVRSISDGKRYLLSAGHCNTGGTWQTRFTNGDIHDIGPTHNAYFNSTGDGMIIRVNNPTGWNPKPWVFVTGDSGTTRDETYTIASSGGTSIGMSVCMTGRRDGTECGVVIDNDTPGAGGVLHVAEVDGGCIRGGDSGGSVYRRNTAYGIVHGGVFPGGDNNYCSITWFYQGVRGAMDKLNVRLVTTSNP